MLTQQEHKKPEEKGVGMRIGVDLGGTKMEAVLLDAQGNIRRRVRVPTPQRDYVATVRGIVALIASLGGERLPLPRHLPVGLGIPGAVSPATGWVKNANSTCLIGKDLAGDLRQALGRPVALANDADCFTLSEATDGSASGAAVVFGAILGTGVGGGIAVGGRLLCGPNAITGEWGHNTLPWPTPEERLGRPCYCGRSGCIETFLSGPALRDDYRVSGGPSLEAKEVVAAAMAGDALAERVLKRYESRLARALAGVINVLDPHVIVLGGGLSNVDRLYHTVPALWEAYVFSDRVTTRLVKAHHGDSSGVRGAAWLWPETEDEAMAPGGVWGKAP